MNPAKTIRERIGTVAIFSIACLDAGRRISSGLGLEPDVEGLLRAGIQKAWWLRSVERAAIASCLDPKRGGPDRMSDPGGHGGSGEWIFLPASAGRILSLLRLPGIDGWIAGWNSTRFDAAAAEASRRADVLSDEEAMEAFERLAAAAGLSAHEQLDKLGGDAP